MRYLIKRNLMLFFRDKANVFFSMLSVLIIIGLYAFFLGDMMVRNFSNLPGAEFLANTWIMAGILTVTPVTTTLGALGIMIEDKVKIVRDFQASPLKRSSLAISYISSAFAISMILTLITLVLAEAYIVIKGGELLSILNLIKVLGLIVFATVSSSFMMFFTASYFKTVNSFGVASTVLGTMIGFLTGMYIPIGVLPGPIQTIIKIFPPSHTGLLFRRVMMEQAEKISFAGVPQEAFENFRLEMGVMYKFGDFDLTPAMSIIYLSAITAIFFALSVWKISKKQK
ncbi:MAG: ABC transporter permease [Eubacteriales bacterium]|nr:ABC transporter permease [Eubacteriales bacterium]